MSHPPDLRELHDRLAAGGWEAVEVIDSELRKGRAAATVDHWGPICALWDSVLHLLRRRSIDVDPADLLLGHARMRPATDPIGRSAKWLLRTRSGTGRSLDPMTRLEPRHRERPAQLVEQRLEGHPSRINGIAVLPGGRAVTSSFSTVCVWNVATGHFERRLGRPGDQSPLTALTSASRMRCAIIRTARVDTFDLRTGDLVRRVASPDMWPSLMTSDGRHFFGVVDGGIRSYDTFTGDKLRWPNDDGEPHATALMLTPDDSILIGAHHRELRLWDPYSARCLATLPTRGGVLSVRVTPDGARAIAVGHHGGATVYALPDGTLERELEGVGPAAMAVSPAGELVCAPLAGEADAMALWSVRTGMRVARLTGAGCPPRQLQFAGSGRVVALCGGRLLVWTVEGGPPVLVSGISTRSEAPLRILDARYALAPAPDGALRVWDLDRVTPACPHPEWDGGRTAITGLAADVGHGRVLACSSPAPPMWRSTSTEGAGGLVELDAARGLSRVRRLPGNSRVLFADTDEQRVVVWDAAHRRTVSERQVPGAWPLAVSSDGELIASYWRGRVIVRAVDGGEEVARSEPLAREPAEAICFANEDADVVLRTQVTRTVLTWSLRTGSPVASDPIWLACHLEPRALQQGGSRALVHVMGEPVRWVEPVRRRILGQLGQARGKPVRLLLTPNGHRGLVASAEGVEIWALERSGATLLRVHRLPATTDLMIHGREGAVTGHDDGTIRCWDLAAGEVLAGWCSTAPISCLAVPEEGAVAYGTDDGEVGVLRLKATHRGRRPTPAATVAAPVRALSWHPHRALVAVAQLDGTVHLLEWHGGSGHLEPGLLLVEQVKGEPSLRWSACGGNLELRPGAPPLSIGPSAALSPEWLPRSARGPDGAVAEAEGARIWVERPEATAAS